MSSADSASSLEVRERAADQALTLLEREGMDDEIAGLRIFIKQGGCAGLSYGLRFDTEPEDDDTVVESFGLRVFVDPQSLQYIEGSVLTYEAGLEDGGFDVENPNVTRECGCGESFRT